MSYTDTELNAIYERTSGYCHICKKKLAFSNYARLGERGAWEVEHSRARCRGGSGHLGNLYAACIGCNRQKGEGTTRAARRGHGRRCAPLSRARRAEAKERNAVLLGLLGLGVGALAGPAGMFIGAAVGAKVGHDIDPDGGR